MNYKNKEWLEKEYETKSMKQIADECGLTPTAIYYWMRKLDIPRRNRIECLIKFFGNKSLNYRNKEWLYEEYINKKRSTTDIAIECNCASSTINNWLNKFEIPIRKRTEGIKNYYSKG